MRSPVSPIPYDPFLPPGTARRREEPRFLCPVCAEDLFEGGALRERPCSHVPLIHSGPGGLHCFDPSIYPAVIAAWEGAGATGRPTLDILRERLGRDFVFFELLATPGEDGEPPVTVVVDLRSEERATAAA